MIFLVIVIGILLQICFIYVEHKKHMVAAMVFKGLASLAFVLLGVVCSSWDPFSNWILAGLIFGMAGDILLAMRYLSEKSGQKIFLVGILVFLMGHVMYLAALLNIAVNPAVSVITGVVITAVLMIWIFKQIKAERAFKIFGFFYIGAVTIMAVTAVMNMLQLGGIVNTMFEAGGVLFLVSDVVMILNTFTEKTRFSLRIANLSLYYVGQLLIAVCLKFL
ncbi:MAG: lysoplasmalogenase [Lachnospiraceae bacterium]|nr:lysoplasmalogenase [Lachnospiraceae bacterium]